MSVGTSTGAVEAALARLAPSLAPGGRSVEHLRQLTGGASLETWSFDVVAERGEVRPLILRRRSTRQGDAFETSLPLATEAALFQCAGAAGVPTPKLVRVCEPEDDLGEAIIVERLAGETLGRRIVADPAFEAARRKLGAQCGAALAAIHGADPANLPLVRLSARDTLGRYEEIWRRSGAQRPTIEIAFRRLLGEAPESTGSELVHGDFRTGNLMVDPDKGLVGVLDWELTHIGDPAEDFGWLCANSWRFGVTDKTAGGFATLDDVLEAYASAGGEPPALGRIRYWQMAGSLKWAVITQMMYMSFALDPGKAKLERALIGRRLSECEVDLLALMDGAC